MADAAAHLDVSEDTVYGWIRAGEIPFVRLNEQYRLSSVDLLEWAVRRGHRVSLEMVQRTHGDAGAAGLAHALELGGVHRLEGRLQRDALLARLVGENPAIEEADRPLLLDLLLASEGLGPTGLGGGVAIPHVRAPVIVPGAAASVATWYLSEPVDFFGAADKLPVDTLFFMVTPSARVHLLLVSRLMAALHDPPFRQALRQRAGLEAVLVEARRVDGAARGPA